MRLALARMVIGLALGSIAGACKIEPIASLELDEPVVIELPGTVQPWALPRVDEGRERGGEPAEVAAAGVHADASVWRLVAAAGRDVLLPLEVLWVLAGRAEAPWAWGEPEPPVP